MFDGKAAEMTEPNDVITVGASYFSTTARGSARAMIRYLSIGTNPFYGGPLPEGSVQLTLDDAEVVLEKLGEIVRKMKAKTKEDPSSDQSEASRREREETEPATQILARGRGQTPPNIAAGSEESPAAVEPVQTIGGMPMAAWKREVCESCEFFIRLGEMDVDRDVNDEWVGSCRQAPPTLRHERDYDYPRIAEGFPACSQFTARKSEIPLPGGLVE